MPETPHSLYSQSFPAFSKLALSQTTSSLSSVTSWEVLSSVPEKSQPVRVQVSRLEVDEVGWVVTESISTSVEVLATPPRCSVSTPGYLYCGYSSPPQAAALTWETSLLLMLMSPPPRLSS